MTIPRAPTVPTGTAQQPMASVPSWVGNFKMANQEHGADDALVEAVAFAMWKAEADRAAPNVGKRRTITAFLGSGTDPETRGKWKDIATAAIIAKHTDRPIEPLSLLYRDLGITQDKLTDMAMDIEQAYDTCLSHETIHGWRTVSDIAATVAHLRRAA